MKRRILNHGIYQIESLTGDLKTQERLLELGFLPGQNIEYKGSLAFQGAILLVLDNTQIALREEEFNCLNLKSLV